ncbi:class I SAM-dependent methyltransferase [Bradyrhizobium manausense]|uniref:class I SAM-dependent methyltransferase n=1 Tax=Bradyrhizobium manausense TaxID=989370 RepID=UPI00201260A1|nr:class I SAM-dependent methyltransferase [Bradyrhizobium manausense]
MGRFASTASTYEHLRPPYPGVFFRNVAQKLGLTERCALIDLGTGPGLLALGFAPYVGRIVGVDPETAMIEAARQAAVRARQALTLIEGKAESLPPDIGTFDIVTIGRALHWMDRDATLARLDGLVARDGVVLICASFSVTDGRNPGSTATTRSAAAGHPRSSGRKPVKARGLMATFPRSFAAAPLHPPSSSRSRPGTRSTCRIWRNARSLTRRPPRKRWATMSRRCCGMSRTIWHPSAATA